MSASNIRFFLLTGDPGVGKTTLTKKLCRGLNEKAVNTVGFYTEEVRCGSVRVGFDVVSLDGKRGKLAREHSLLAGPVNYKVGKYGVLVQEFENIALPILETSPGSKGILVVDEIGKMECYSEAFKSKIRYIFGSSSNSVVLATIPSRKSDAVIEGIRNSSRAKVWLVTKGNRNEIHEDILRDILTVL